MDAEVAQAVNALGVLAEDASDALLWMSQGGAPWATELLPTANSSQLPSARCVCVPLSTPRQRRGPRTPAHKRRLVGAGALASGRR
jgi:hypothetical protein